MALPPPGFCLFLFKVDLVSAGNGVSPTAAGMQARLSLCHRDGGQSALGAQLGAALEMTLEIGLASSDTEGEGGPGFPELPAVSTSQDTVGVFADDVCIHV